MGKFNPSAEKVSVSLGKSIVENGIVLGRSRYEKDCCWGCYQYKDKFYISLNGWSDSVWEADREDIDNYIDVGTSVYEEMIEEERCKNVADKES